MFMFEVKDHSVKFNESLRGFFCMEVMCWIGLCVV